MDDAIEEHERRSPAWPDRLKSCNFRPALTLAGDLLSEIEVEGVQEWQAALLKMAWCKFEGPADEQLKFLLGLPDGTIASLAHRVGGDLANRQALKAVDRIRPDFDSSK